MKLKYVYIIHVNVVLPLLSRQDRKHPSAGGCYERASLEYVNDGLHASGARRHRC